MTAQTPSLCNKLNAPEEEKREFINALKLLAEDHDTEILSLLGFDNVGMGGVQCACPVHGGDNPTAFSYTTSKKVWKCFTHKCDKEYGCDILGLIRGVKNCNFDDAIRWLYDVVAEGEDVNWSKLEQQAEWNKAKSLYMAPTNKAFDADVLDRWEENYDYAINRGFRMETCRFFDVRSTSADRIFHHRLMCPIHNKLGHIVGFTGRSLYEKCGKCGTFHPEDGECPTSRWFHIHSKWRNYPAKFNKTIELYNIHNAKEHIYKTNVAIIVEGPFDVWRLHELGIYNVVATFGVSLSDFQCRLLAECGAIDLIVVYDSDNAGKEAIEEIIEKASSIFRVYAAVLPDNVDPGEISLEEYNEYINPYVEQIKEAYSHAS
jgi:5S rRNA maturation endonuclease (ribonuclease M5)